MTGSVSGQFERYFSLTGELLVSLDIEGLITQVNPRACEVLGYQREELIGLCWFDHFVPERLRVSVTHVTERLWSEQESQAERFVNPVVTRSGEERIISWHNMVVKNLDGVVTELLSSGEDITDRVQSEQALRRSEESYRLLIETIPLGIQENDTAGRITFANEANCDMFGYSHEEYVGQYIWDTFAGDPKELEDYLAYLVEEQPEPTPYIGTYVKKDGSRITAQIDWNYKRDDAGKLIGFISVVTDITERLRSEQALRDNERQLRAIMNSLRETSIVVYDYDGRVQAMWDESDVDKKYGIRAEQMIGKLISDILPRKQAEDRLRHVRYVIDSGNKLQTEHRNTLPGGEFWFDSTLTPMVNDDGSISSAVGFLRDMTQRKETDKLLRENESRLQGIMNSLYHSSIVIYDRDGFITAMWGDEQQDKLYGLPFHDVIGKNITELLPQSEAMLRREQIQHVFDTGESTLVEHCRSLDDGMYWTESSLSPIRVEEDKITGVIAFVRDTTDRRKAEESLKALNSQLEFQVRNRTQNLSFAISKLESEVNQRREIENELRISGEKYRSIVETSADWIWEKDLTLRHIYSNDRVYQILGYTPEEVQELDFMKRFHPDEAEENIELFNFWVANKSGWSSWTRQVRHKDGSYRVLESTALPTLDENGKLIGYRGIDRDVTDRLRSEELIQSHKDNLAHVSRLSTMGATVSGLAHELNQPLSAVTIYADACVKMNDPMLTTELSKTLRKIASQAERAGKIIHRVQEFTRKGEPHCSSFDLNELIHETIPFVDLHASLDSVRISLDLSEEIPVIIADSIQIQQVLLNLIRNAFDSMKHEVFNEHKLIVKSFIHDDNFVSVSVGDTGCGFDQRNASDLFDSFFTSKPDGMGLGLSISRSIIEAHGGQLNAELNTDRGSTFTLSLPITRGNAHADQ